MIVKIVRNALGLIIVFFDWLTRPKAKTRSQSEQARVQESLKGHSLYQFFACPFCVKTRRALHQLGVSVESKYINKDLKHRTELEQGGGRIKVPCLRIEQGEDVRWIYDSNQIIDYIQQRIA